MDHPALNRPGANDGYLNHQIVELRRFQARQHRHLRPRLDLEHANGVSAADHLVGRFVFGRNRRQTQVQIAMATQQVEATTNRAEHAEGEDIHLEQAHRIEVVLVPLDDRALGHRGVLHRHQRVQRLLGNHETTGVLRQMSGEADQLSGQAQHPAQHRALRVETTLEQTLDWRRFIAPVAAAIGQCVDLIRRQAQGLGHIAYGASGVVGADHCGQCCATAAIATEHVLQDFFAAFVLEVDVDVRRFVALLRHKAFEQQRGAIRVDLGDAQGKAHRRVGRRATALTENALLAGKAHHVMYGEEVAFIAEFGDQLQLLVDLPQHLEGRALFPAPGDAFLGQLP
ncbi:hypothetical protein PS624_04701 [Pseudomonas fluorescens]|uniref:Uncharacterized protein n=1 Tax=Pseudomonas fluorescens TaxID=294 RepID=A0A5E6WIX4_PSEFL|nr:hypothetical protein PS624_04701 [Pseudomonas fluorescens]